MSDRESKYVVSNRPANRRTAGRLPLPPAPVSPLVQERTAAAHARQRLGAPLAELLRGRGAARQPLPAAAVVSGMVAAGGAIAVFLGLLQGSLLLGAGGVLAAAAGAGTAWRLRRPAGTAVPDTSLTPLLDAETIAVFDQALAQVASELPQDAAAQVGELKHLVVRIARHSAATAADEYFTFDDRMYVGQCVRRYLPDALQAYFAVPKAQRAVILAEGQTPHALLLGQVEFLKCALQEREQKLARSAAEQLLRQERFLKAKR